MSDNNTKDDVELWWQTAIIDMAPGKINFRGKPIETLIGNRSFAQMIWFMVMGSELSAQKAALFEAALVAGVDHGPQAPSIAAARMAATCGVGLNNVIATGVNMLGDIHGGAGEQCAELFYLIDDALEKGNDLLEATRIGIEQWRSQYGAIISGFGHRFHKPNDPRAPRVLELVRAAAKDGVISGRFADIAESIQRQLHAEKGKALAMNIDGSSAIIFCELGVPPPLSRGFFCLSRSVGILAHSWEQMQQGGRNKGPMPPQYLPRYSGPK